MARRRGGKRSPSPQPASSGGPVARLAPWAAVAVGILFLVAGLGKVLEPLAFFSSLPAYGLDGWPRYPLTVLLPGIEVVIGAMLVAGWRRWEAAAVAAVLLGLFIVAIGLGSSRGTLEECGCFGPFLERSPRDALLIDVGFLALAGLALVGSRPGAGPPLAGWRAVLLVMLAFGSVGAAASSFLGAPAGVSAAAPAVEEVDLSRGEHLLYLFHHECPHCAEMSPRVAGYTRAPSLPGVVGFTFRTSASDLERYRARYDFEFPVQVLAPSTFASITGEGAVPQLVYLRDGAIVRTWLGLLPTPEELARELARRPR